MLEGANKASDIMQENRKLECMRYVKEDQDGDSGEWTEKVSSINTSLSGGVTLSQQ